MQTQDGKLIVIHEFPTPNLQPFLNPICKDTYNALPKIYGRKGKKRYLLGLPDYMKAQPAPHCSRDCCRHEYEERYRSNTEVKHPRKIKLDPMLTQAKLENCKKRNCICHLHAPVTSKHSKTPDKHEQTTTKLKKIMLPNLKEFNTEDIKESESGHKVIRTVGTMSLEEPRMFDSRKIEAKVINRKPELHSGHSSSKGSYINGFERTPHNEKSRDVEEQAKFTRFNTEATPENKRYYEYLENDPNFRSEPPKANHVKRSNTGSDDTYSISSFSVQNKKDSSTIFHQQKKKLEVKLSNSQIADKKHSKAYSVLSNGLFKIPEEEEFEDYLLNYKPMNPEFDLKQLVKEPNFQIVPANGKVYFGQITNDRRNGKGITISEKEIYEGKYQNDAKTYGCEKNRDGIYTGEFLKGKRHGQGKFVWVNGEEFEGEWREGKKNGHGIWKSPKGDYYDGEWKENRQNGKGYHFHNGGSKYNGYFKDFLKHGKGDEEFPNGDRYTGEYLAGKPHGFGRYVWANCDVYQGEFTEGSRDGKGKLKKAVEVYEGSFKNDMKHGMGKEIYKSGEYFQGEFIEGQKHRGKLHTKNGAVIDISPQ